MTLDHPHPVREGTNGNITSGGVRVTVDRVHFEELLRVNLSQGELAQVLGCGVEAIERFCQENYGMTFETAKALAMTRVKAMLVKRALAMAMEGESSMIQICLRNLCGWDVEEGRPVSRSSFSKGKRGRSARPGHGQGMLPGLLN